MVAVIVIGVASTAPGYSLAASIGLVTDAANVKAPFIMLFAFVPMACIAASFYYLNKADPDCGTNFTWGVRAFGPKAGWIAGWGCIVADLVIMPNLAGVSGQYLVLLFKEEWADNIYITTTKKIILSYKDLKIKTKKTTKMNIDNTFDLNVKDKAGIKAGPQLNLKASRVNIN